MTQPQRTWWMKPGARTLQTLVAQLDRLTAQRSTEASTQWDDKCCFLAKSPDPNCYNFCINHGGGYWIQYWWCCSGGWRYQCQECTTQNTCWTSDVLCSNYAGGWIC